MPPPAIPLNPAALAVFAFFFALVTVLGFLASRWKAPKTLSVAEWGLGGRQFGTLISWCLIGGDFYTAYTIVAVPALVFSLGAEGFFALPYTILVYPIVFLLMPRLWSVCQVHHLVTPADFVQLRYGSRLLTLAITLTGILSLLPYIALQLVGMEVAIAQLGLRGSSSPFLRDLPVTLAFLILALYTYSAGLRAPAMIAFVKDVMIYLVVFAAILLIPWRLGGYPHIFHQAAHLYSQPGHTGSLILPPARFMAYSSLALGSALAAFMYPHTITSVLSSQSREVVRRNAVLLPAYTLLLGMLALIGIVAVAAGIHPADPRGVVTSLFASIFPGWMLGFCCAAIAIAALVPAAIMSIAAANLFTRNVYLAFLNPSASEAKQSRIAKNASVLVKFAALAFVLFLPTRFATDLQLLGGIWILQTFPAIALGLWRRLFHHHALTAGWLAGLTLGSALALTGGVLRSVVPLTLGRHTTQLYIGVLALAVNLAVAALLTLALDAAGVPRQPDGTSPSDF